MDTRITTSVCISAACHKIKITVTLLYILRKSKYYQADLPTKKEKLRETLECQGSYGTEILPPFSYLFYHTGIQWKSVQFTVSNTPNFPLRFTSLPAAFAFNPGWSRHHFALWKSVQTLNRWDSLIFLFVYHSGNTVLSFLQKMCISLYLFLLLPLSCENKPCYQF